MYRVDKSLTRPSVLRGDGAYCVELCQREEGGAGRFATPLHYQEYDC